MKKIVYSRPDGGVSVVTPALNLHSDPPDTEDDAVARAMKRLPEDAIAPRVVDANEIPADRTFRNAWKADLTVDMAKARAIHRNKLRELRAPLFEPLERAQRTALVSGDTATALAIETKLQTLRNVTADPAIEAASTPEELKSIQLPV
jgi:hypothetical protein